MEIVSYSVNKQNYNLTTEKIDDSTTALYLTDFDKNVIDFPSNTILYFYNNEKKNIVECSNNRYFMYDDINYEIQINDVIWSIENKKMWNYELLKY